MPRTNAKSKLTKVLSKPPRFGRLATEEIAGNDGEHHYDPDRARALQVMRQIWTFAGKYFPKGAQMPAPNFYPTTDRWKPGSKYVGPGETPDAHVELEPDGAGGFRGSHVVVPRELAKDLSRSSSLFNDAAESSLLHEWAHMFQSPEVLGDPDESVRESGAEAFAWDMAPIIMRQAGRKYNQKGSQPALSLKPARARGKNWIRRGQFRKH